MPPIGTSLADVRGRFCVARDDTSIFVSVLRANGGTIK